ncbi:hypothetical protein ZWY2020_042227 [Hordeum vulgare]|nr:hypothetical protein ZWY2020_042227 [Hordeum vulgare]
MVQVKDVGQRGKFKLIKPSNLSPTRDMEVLLELERPAYLHSLQIMLKVRHPNVLRLEGYFHNTSSRLLAPFVEPYTGRLSIYIMSLKVSSYLKIVPSVAFQDIIRQIINELAELAANGCYHGNFKFENTYYKTDEKGNFTVKLSEFAPKVGMTIAEAQVSDWNDLAAELDSLAKNIASRPSYENVTLLKHLATELKSIKDVWHWKKDSKWCLLLGQENKNPLIHIYSPNGFNDSKVAEWVHNHHKCQIPWDANDYLGLNIAMNTYRYRKFKTTYNGRDKVQHLRFVSGCYAHEEELQDYIPSNRTVDDIIQICDLGVFLEASRLIPR